VTHTESDLSALLAAVTAGEITDPIRTSLAWVLQELIELEATHRIGAAHGQRSESRTTQRNGHRPKVITTAAGDITVEIPKLRTGSFFPSILERRRRIDRALFAVVMEAYVHGVSTRKVDDLVKALGADSGISKSEVSRICAELDTELEAFRNRPLEGEFPYVFVDATYIKARVRGRVVSRAVVIATGVRADGGREVLGVDIGDSEAGPFWQSFFRSLKARGLAGVQLVISDHHAGLRAAIDASFIGAAWQRCRVHFMRNVLARVPKASTEMVAAAIRTVFAQPDAAHVRSQLTEITAMLAAQLCSAADPGHWFRLIPDSGFGGSRTAVPVVPGRLGGGWWSTKWWARGPESDDLRGCHSIGGPRARKEATDEEGQRGFAAGGAGPVD
jgi:transposase-like protein